MPRGGSNDEPGERGAERGADDRGHSGSDRPLDHECGDDATPAQAERSQHAELASALLGEHHDQVHEQEDAGGDAETADAEKDGSEAIAGARRSLDDVAFGGADLGAQSQVLRIVAGEGAKLSNDLLGIAVGVEDAPVERDEQRSGRRCRDPCSRRCRAGGLPRSGLQRAGCHQDVAVPREPHGRKHSIDPGGPRGADGMHGDLVADSGTETGGGPLVHRRSVVCGRRARGREPPDRAVRAEVACRRELDLGNARSWEDLRCGVGLVGRRQGQGGAGGHRGHHAVDVRKPCMRYHVLDVVELATHVRGWGDRDHHVERAEVRSSDVS